MFFPARHRPGVQSLGRQARGVEIRLLDWLSMRRLAAAVLADFAGFPG